MDRDLDALKDIPAQPNTLTHLSRRRCNSSEESESKDRSSIKAFTRGTK